MKLISRKILCSVFVAILLIACFVTTSCAKSDAIYCSISTENAKATIENIGGTNNVEQINCNVANSDSYKKMIEQVDVINKYGKKFGFLMLDIKSCKGVAYNIDFPWTSQSTIKGPYIASLLESNPNIWNEEKDKIKDVITLSSNNKYDEIREKYGNDAFKNFCSSVNVDTKNCTTLYPREITVRDMAKIWTKMYTLLNHKNDTTGSFTEFAKLFEHTVYSPTQDVIGRNKKTHCKSGWEEGLAENPDGTLSTSPKPTMTDGDPKNDEIATNDTGIVYDGENPYILIMFSSFAASPTYLYDFAEAIDNVHTEIVKQ